jgi:peroxiredoxin
MKRIFILCIAGLLALSAVAQNGYKISLKITGASYSSLLLTTYYGNKIKLVDTAFAVHPGLYVFEGNHPLDGGIYMAVSPKKVKLFEFVVNKNQQFTLQTDTAEFVMHMKVKNSRENELFFSYLQFNDGIYRQIKALRASLTKENRESPTYKKLQQKIDSLNKASADYKLQIIRKYPDLFVSRLFDAMREVEVPKNHPVSDSLYGYHYLRNHFWDHFRLNDPRLLHTPLYDRKIKAYFKHLVPFHPDSVIASIDKVIALARPSNECVSQLVWYFTVEYQNPKYMGFDKVFVHMVDRYFATEAIKNTTPSIKKLLLDRADKIRPLLIGKPAPDLILVDTSGNYVGFRSIKQKFTLLFFWDYHCSICKKEIGQLIPMYKSEAKKMGLEVYAISINPDLKKWKEAVRNRHLPWINVNGTHSMKGDFTKQYDIHGTPQLYLLNEKKEIIAKQFSVDQLRLIINEYLLKEKTD